LAKSLVAGKLLLYPFNCPKMLPPVTATSFYSETLRSCRTDSSVGVNACFVIGICVSELQLMRHYRLDVLFEHKSESTQLFRGRNRECSFFYMSFIIIHIISIIHMFLICERTVCIHFKRHNLFSY